MRRPRLKPPVRRTRRRWRVPPAITHGSEAFEGLGILDEVQGRLGLVFWQTARDVSLWAAAAEEGRGALFAPGAEERRRAVLRGERVDAALETPLAELAELLGRPGAMTGELVARACHRVASWADERELTATALSFVQAAATAAPANAETAYTVARLARRRAEDARAESWFRRSIALGRQSGDWLSYALAFLGLGELYAQRGNPSAARRFYVRALRAARRHSLHSAAGMALHELAILLASSGRPEEAERAARGAYEEYGADHPRLPALARDVALLWTEEGHFARALPLLHAVLPHATRPEERLVVEAGIARAAAGVGGREGPDGAAERDDSDAFAEDLLRSLRRAVLAA